MAHFLIDANLPRATLALLTNAGHAAEHVRDLGLGAATDEVIIRHAQESGAVLLTRDLDFADVRRYPPQQHSGIVVLRLSDDAVTADITDVLSRFISHKQVMGHLSGRLIILEANRFRVRPPLE